MANFLFVVLSILIGAFAFRFRGGGFMHVGSTTVVRLGWALALPLSATLFLWDATPLWIVPGFFLGAIFGWYDSFDMGRLSQNIARDSTIMFARGFIWTAPAGVIVIILGNVLGGLFILVSGVAVPLIYDAFWRFPKIKFVKSTIASAEYAYGGWIGFWWGFAYYVF